MKVKKILLVDDELSITKLLGFSLSESGFEVKTAASGEAALALFAKETFDLAMIDINMPKMNGFEVIFHLRKKKPDIKVFIVSGVIDASLAQRIDKLGVEEIIAKPFDIKQLLDKLHHHLADK